MPHTRTATSRNIQNNGYHDFGKNIRERHFPAITAGTIVDEWCHCVPFDTPGHCRTLDRSLPSTSVANWELEDHGSPCHLRTVTDQIINEFFPSCGSCPAVPGENGTKRAVAFAQHERHSTLSTAQSVWLYRMDY